MMNNIEILEKLKDEQYTKETVNTLYEFYDEEFKPYVLSTEERDALENLIQENKELKEKAKNTMGLIGANYIHKDKVKDYLNKMEKRCNKPKFSIMKKDIEKLLEEGE